MGIKKCTFTKAYTRSLVHKNCRSQFQCDPFSLDLLGHDTCHPIMHSNWKKAFCTWLTYHCCGLISTSSTPLVLVFCQYEDFSQALFIASTRLAPQRKPQESTGEPNLKH